MQFGVSVTNGRRVIPFSSLRQFTWEDIDWDPQDIPLVQFLSSFGGDRRTSDVGGIDERFVVGTYRGKAVLDFNNKHITEDHDRSLARVLERTGIPYLLDYTATSNNALLLNGQYVAVNDHGRSWSAPGTVDNFIIGSWLTSEGPIRNEGELEQCLQCEREIRRIFGLEPLTCQVSACKRREPIRVY